MRLLGIIGGAVLLAAGGAALVAAQSDRHVRDTPEAETLVNRCAFCHGPDGISQNPIWPSLAGMDAAYLERQLQAYAEGPTGARRSAHAIQMYGLSEWLGQEGRATLAQYFAALPPPSWSPAAEAGEARELYVSGDGAVLACATCHGADASGQAELRAPRLAGQSARYLADQLNAYASGTRDDEGSGMAAISSAMTDEQIAAVSAYLARRGPNHDQ